VVWCATVSLKAVIHSRRKAERKLKSICRQLSQTHRVANRGHQPCAGSATEWDPSARGLPTRTGPRGPRGISRTLRSPPPDDLLTEPDQTTSSQPSGLKGHGRARTARPKAAARPPPGGGAGGARCADASNARGHLIITQTFTYEEFSVRPTQCVSLYFFCFRVYSRINQHHPIPTD
jgi:hypothetical protein